MKEEEMGKKTSRKRPGKFGATLKRLPPPFAIIDHLVFMVVRSFTNSLHAFNALVFVPLRENEEFFDEIPLSEVKGTLRKVLLSETLRRDGHPI